MKRSDMQQAPFIALTAMLAFLGPCSPGLADIIRGKESSFHGRVIVMDRSNIRVAEGCRGANELRLSWTDVESVTFEDSCGLSNSADVPINQDCSDGTLDVFQVELREGTAPIIAESVAITTNGYVHLDTFSPWQQAHGPATSVAAISKRTICRSQIPQSYDVPLSFCRENRQIAVAFDYRNPLSNRILTNGFSFVLRPVGPVPSGFDLDAFGVEVRSAFQSGLSLWTSSLKEIEQKLSSDLRKFLDARTSRSPNGYQMFIPPQVVRLSCPQSATFVVELGFEDRELFPDFPLVLARAKIEGRTIALNMRQFKCFKSQLKFNEKKQLSFELDGGCINLVPIMAHELGHAFGLNHFDEGASHALMDSRFSRDALSPTERDVLAFAGILEQSIAGAAPGELRFVHSSGVSPPEDWVADAPTSSR